MHYLSTRNNKLKESFLNVLFQGLSKEGGLFMPFSWPAISIKNLRGKNYQEIAYDVISPFIQDDISDDDLRLILDKTYQCFNHENVAPLLNIEKNKYILELFYGPTLAFKDYALQLLGNLFLHFKKNINKKLTILGATSGDTGSAAINAFKGKDNINIFILHPYNKVSDVQRRQMTTILDDNVFNIAVEGTFDDCQRIVKEIFVNDEIQKKTSLTAINSINWARLMVQTVYYFWAYLQLNESKVSFIVPSGNFGNIYSAHIAKHMGLPIDKLHIATNQNDVLHKIISLGQMKMKKVEQTYSPSMDIQISSNFERLIYDITNDPNYIKKIMNELNEKQSYKLDAKIISAIKKSFQAYSINQSEVKSTISSLYNEHNIIIDPHTAVGLAAARRHMSNENTYITLSTAHPSKFKDTVTAITKDETYIPNKVKNLFNLDEKLVILRNDKNLVKDFILENIK